MGAYEAGGKLRPGIVEKLGQALLPEPVSYLDEVRGFLKNSGNSSFPFMNQEKPFRRMLSYLAQSPYPYAVLVGPPGIGKTMMTDYLLGIIENRVPDEELRKAGPDLPEEAKLIRSRLDKFEHRDYMILPNLYRPRTPVVLPYRKDAIEKDMQAATEYSKALASLLMNYVRDNADRMRLKFSTGEFSEYFLSKVAEFYVSAYETWTK